MGRKTPIHKELRDIEIGTQDECNERKYFEHYTIDYFFTQFLTVHGASR